MNPDNVVYQTAHGLADRAGEDLTDEQALFDAACMLVIAFTWEANETLGGTLEAMRAKIEGDLEPPKWWFG